MDFFSALIKCGMTDDSKCRMTDGCGEAVYASSFITSQYHREMRIITPKPARVLMK